MNHYDLDMPQVSPINKRPSFDGSFIYGNFNIARSLTQINNVHKYLCIYYLHL